MFGFEPLRFDCIKNTTQAFSICDSVFSTQSDILTVPTPKIEVCSLLLIGALQASEIVSFNIV